MCFVADLLERRPVPAGLRACGVTPDEARMTWHHLVPAQRIRKEFPHGAVRVMGGWSPYDPRLAYDRVGGAVSPLAELVADRRNQVYVCWKHHQHVENRRIVIWREDLPPGFDAFCGEYGLEGWASRYFPPAPSERAA